MTLVFLLVLPVLALVGLRLMSAEPGNLGVTDGNLSGCPQSPNCVSTRAGDAQHRIEPLRIEGTREEAVRRVKAAIATIPRLQIVAEEQGYLRAEATSRLFRFVDDVEFLVEDGTGLVQARSASRVGYSDFGANRKRLDQIREVLEASP